MQRDDWESAMWLIEDPEDFRARFDRIKKALENAREEYDRETAALLEKAETGELDRMINAEADQNARVVAARAEMDVKREAYAGAKLDPAVAPDEKLRLWEEFKAAENVYTTVRSAAQNEALARIREPMRRALAKIETLEAEFMRLQELGAFLLPIQNQLKAVENHVKAVESRTEAIESRTKAVESRTDHLWGNDLERMMPKKIGARLRTKWNLRRHTILWSVLHDMDRNLMEDLDDAKDEGRLTEEEYARIWNTDLILKAFTWNGEHDEVWVALEISATINDDDIERAAKSADIIQRVLGKRAFASVAGYNISDPQIEKAEQADVKILRFS